MLLGRGRGWIGIIAVERPPIVRLLDFGIARRSGTPSDTGLLQGAGSAEYMPPEQSAASGEVTARIDVYQLGCVLYEFVTLRLPFNGEQRELQEAHAAVRPPRPSKFAPVPPALEAVILTCLSKQPSLRYADAGALLTSFRATFASAVPAGAASAATSSAAAGVEVASAKARVALLYFTAEPDATFAAQEAVKHLGGHPAAVNGSQCVAVFTLHSSEQPAERALAAGVQLVERGHAIRAIVDVGSISVKTRPDGSLRFAGQLLKATERYPSEDDPRAVMLSAEAKDVLANVRSQPVKHRPGYFAVANEQARALTSTHQGSALSPMLGRETLLNRLLDDAKAAAVSLEPRVITVFGEAGLGKTRLTRELTRQCEQRFPTSRVLDLRATQPIGATADALLCELVRLCLDAPATLAEPAARALLIDRLGELGRDAYGAIGLLLSSAPAPTTPR